MEGWMCSASLMSDRDLPHFAVWKLNSYVNNSSFLFDIFVLQVEEKIPKVSKKPQMMDAPCPAQTQDEETEETVKKTLEPEGKDSRNDTLQENTEQFFVTQVRHLFPYCPYWLGNMNSTTYIAFQKYTLG